MNDMKRDSIENTIHEVDGKLFDVAAELRAMAYLFETQGIKANQISETDMDEIGHGIGRMLKRLARQVRRTVRDLDDILTT